MLVWLDGRDKGPKGRCHPLSHDRVKDRRQELTGLGVVLDGRDDSPVCRALALLLIQQGNGFDARQELIKVTAHANGLHRYLIREHIGIGHDNPQFTLSSKIALQGMVGRQVWGLWGFPCGTASLGLNDFSGQLGIIGNRNL